MLQSKWWLVENREVRNVYSLWSEWSHSQMMSNCMKITKRLLYCTLLYCTVLYLCSRLHLPSRRLSSLSVSHRPRRLPPAHHILLVLYGLLCVRTWEVETKSVGEGTKEISEIEEEDNMFLKVYIFIQKDINRMTVTDIFWYWQYSI